jgi:hypothetical protein
VLNTVGSSTINGRIHQNKSREISPYSFCRAFHGASFGKRTKAIRKMDCVENIVGYIVFNILNINPSFLDEIQNVFLSE